MTGCPLCGSPTHSAGDCPSNRIGKGRPRRFKGGKGRGKGKSRKGWGKGERNHYEDMSEDDKWVYDATEDMWYEWTEEEDSVQTSFNEVKQWSVQEEAQEDEEDTEKPRPADVQGLRSDAPEFVPQSVRETFPGSDRSEVHPYQGGSYQEYVLKSDARSDCLEGHSYNGGSDWQRTPNLIEYYSAGAGETSTTTRRSSTRSFLDAEDLSLHTTPPPPTA